MQNLLRIRKVSLIKVTTEKVTTRVMTVMTDRINRTKMYMTMVDVIIILTIITQDRQKVNETNPVFLTSNLTNFSNLTPQDNFNEKAFYI
jgi:hypothetical protein